MFRFLLFVCSLFMVLPIQSQGIVRQQGYVRTVGRPGNKAGQRLSGVVIKVSGQHNMVKSGKNGKFALAFNGLREGKDAFSFTSVRLAGYDLQEMEIIGRRYALSATVPVEVVLVPQTLKREIEVKVRRTVENEYQKKLRRIEQLRLKDAARYQQQLQLLEAEYDKRDQLVNDMVERYASTDYARLDSFTTRINRHIENGELEVADSLIRSQNLPRLEAERKTLQERSVQLRQEWENSEKAAKVATERIVNLLKSKAELHLARMEQDSASFCWDQITSLSPDNEAYWREAALRHSAIGMLEALYDKSHLRKAVECYKHALELLAKMKNEPCEEMAECYRGMELVYGLLGVHSTEFDTLALVCAQKVDSIRRRMQAEVPTTRESAVDMAHLAFRLFKAARYEEAFEYSARAFVACTSTMGSETPILSEVQRTAYESLCNLKEHGSLSQVRQASVLLADFMKEHLFTVSFDKLDGLEPSLALEKGLSGKYYLMELNDWNVNSMDNLYRIEENLFYEMPETIVVCREGECRQEHFQKAEFLNLKLQYVTPEERKRVIEDWENWKLCQVWNSYRKK